MQSVMYLIHKKTFSYRNIDDLIPAFSVWSVWLGQWVWAACAKLAAVDRMRDRVGASGA